MQPLQRVVEPMLLSRRKFELRIYFTISSTRPLVVDLYLDGIARYAGRSILK